MLNKYFADFFSATNFSYQWICQIQAYQENSKTFSSETTRSTWTHPTRCWNEAATASCCSNLVSGSRSRCLCIKVLPSIFSPSSSCAAQQQRFQQSRWKILLKRWHWYVDMAFKIHCEKPPLAANPAASSTFGGCGPQIISHLCLDSLTIFTCIKSEVSDVFGKSTAPLPHWFEFDQGHAVSGRKTNFQNYAHKDCYLELTSGLFILEDSDLCMYFRKRPLLDCSTCT